MRWNEFSPMLWTFDLDASIVFYTTILGFTLSERRDDWRWASLQKDRITIMFAVPQQESPSHPPKYIGSLYFRVDDVDALWNSLKDRTNVCYPLENFPYGMREFAIYDNNGHLLQFGMEIGTTETSVAESP